MLRIAIVDDLAEDRERLARQVNACFARRETQADCRTFPDAAAFLEAHAASPFELAFLDIRMEALDGIELSRQLRRADSRLLIVFISSSREYAFEAFPIHPFDYLVKPCPDERVRGVLDEALRMLTDPGPEIIVRVPHADLRLPLQRVSAVIARGHGVEIVLTDGRRLRSVMTFSELCGRLSADGRFLLLNRGVLINMGDVLTVQGESMRMQTGDIYPIRTRGRAELISRFTQYQIGRLRKEK